MPRKRFEVEQIINNLREADVLLARGETVGSVCRRIGVSEQSYYRLRKEYGGLKIEQASRTKTWSRRTLVRSSQSPSRPRTSRF